MLRSLLVANRGEIACRILRTVRRMGLRTVAVFSDTDAEALHVALADEAVRIGPAPAAQSYLDAGAILAAARRTGAEAVHPGYGFLSENADFAQSIEEAGLVFVGPSPAAIRAMGLKDAAKRLMREAGVPVVPGWQGETQDPETLLAEAERIGWPVLVKARAGGGGRGMRRVDRREDFIEALTSARREAEAAFGDGHCLIERYLAAPRHVEVQILADGQGRTLHLFERDCSLQRRHQKVIEEAPAPGMTVGLREAMGRAAVRAAEAVGYRGAGTVEFILDASEGLREDRFFFMEMNTRLQVEHPVTEEICGLDLVEWQLRVAAGEPLPFAQGDLRTDGHAVEARLYAEDPARDFLPATGRLDVLRFPEGSARIETGVREGDVVSPHYDPMIAKIVARGETRAEAWSHLAQALAGTRIAGVETNLPFLRRLAQDPDVLAGRLDTGLIARKETGLTARAADRTGEALALAALKALGHLEAEAPTSGWSDPFETLRGFRLWGPARQVARFAGPEGQPIEASVTSEPGGVIRVAAAGGELSVRVAERRADGTVSFERDGHRRRAEVLRDAAGVTVFLDGAAHRFDWAPEAEAEAGGQAGAPADGDGLAAPMPGLVRLVAVAPGERVTRGQALVVIEAMKMEHTLRAPRDGRVATLAVAVGDAVESGASLLSLEPAP